jgi:hypothetical protein
MADRGREPAQQEPFAESESITQRGDGEIGPPLERYRRVYQRVRDSRPSVFERGFQNLHALGDGARVSN